MTRLENYNNLVLPEIKDWPDWDGQTALELATPTEPIPKYLSIAFDATTNRVDFFGTFDSDKLDEAKEELVDVLWMDNAKIYDLDTNDVVFENKAKEKYNA
jgi:hypothetical protein